MKIIKNTTIKLYHEDVLKIIKESIYRQGYIIKDIGYDIDMVYVNDYDVDKTPEFKGITCYVHEGTDKNETN